MKAVIAERELVIEDNRKSLATLEVRCQHAEGAVVQLKIQIVAKDKRLQDLEVRTADLTEKLLLSEQKSLALEASIARGRSVKLAEESKIAAILHENEHVRKEMSLLRKQTVTAEAEFKVHMHGLNESLVESKRNHARVLKEKKADRVELEALKEQLLQSQQKTDRLMVWQHEAQNRSKEIERLQSINAKMRNEIKKMDQQNEMKGSANFEDHHDCADSSGTFKFAVIPLVKDRPPEKTSRHM